MIEVLTIGHSNHSEQEFIRLLQKHNAAGIIDVRSVPASGRFPQYNKRSLKQLLSASGLAYVWLGDALGGKGPAPIEQQLRSPAAKHALQQVLDLCSSQPPTPSTPAGCSSALPAPVGAAAAAAAAAQHPGHAANTAAASSGAWGAAGGSVAQLATDVGAQEQRQQKTGTTGEGSRSGGSGGSGAMAAALLGAAGSRAGGGSGGMGSQALPHGRWALMCSEAHFTNCHRQAVAAALVERGAKVLHILPSGQLERHPATLLSMWGRAAAATGASKQA